jgi:hypothetical protein
MQAPCQTPVRQISDTTPFRYAAPGFIGLLLSNVPGYAR